MSEDESPDVNDPSKRSFPASREARKSRASGRLQARFLAVVVSDYWRKLTTMTQDFFSRKFIVLSSDW